MLSRVSSHASMSIEAQAAPSAPATTRTLADRAIMWAFVTTFVTFVAAYLAVLLLGVRWLLRWVLGV